MTIAFRTPRRWPWFLLLALSAALLVAASLALTRFGWVIMLPETVQLAVFLVAIGDGGPPEVVAACICLVPVSLLWWVINGRRQQHPYLTNLFRSERLHDRAVDALDSEIATVLRSLGPMDATWEARILGARAKLAEAAQLMCDLGPVMAGAEQVDREAKSMGAKLLARLRLVDDAIARRDPDLLRAYQEADPSIADYARLNALVEPLR